MKSEITFSMLVCVLSFLFFFCISLVKSNSFIICFLMFAILSMLCWLHPAGKWDLSHQTAHNPLAQLEFSLSAGIQPSATGLFCKRSAGAFFTHKDKPINTFSHSWKRQQCLFGILPYDNNWMQRGCGRKWGKSLEFNLHQLYRMCPQSSAGSTEKTKKTDQLNVWQLFLTSFTFTVVLFSKAVKAGGQESYLTRLRCFMMNNERSVFIKSLIGSKEKNISVESLRQSPPACQDVIEVLCR